MSLSRLRHLGALVLATLAAQRDLIVFLSAGGIQEIRFPGYLTAEEESWRHEQDHPIG